MLAEPKIASDRPRAEDIVRATTNKSAAMAGSLQSENTSEEARGVWSMGVGNPK